MKPLKLTIEGINSFVESRTVDFETLGADGIFCICGPTGSGKTTVLDCMILALYGENKNRGNLVDYINTKCDKGKISFEFESDGERYSIYREIRRKSASAAKLYKSGGEVIADRADTVTDEVKKMLKLEKDEFTKVVILEQGKFSQFMQMGGKDRSKTVSKLFSLEKYDRLKETFAAAARKYDGFIKNAESALMQYADYTEEKYADLKRECKQLGKDSAEQKKQIAEKEKAVKAGEKLMESAKRRSAAEEGLSAAEAELKAAQEDTGKLSELKMRLDSDRLALDNLKEQSAAAQGAIVRAEECAKDGEIRSGKAAERDALREKLRVVNSSAEALERETEALKGETEANLSNAESIMRDIASLGYGVKECTEAEFAAVKATAAADAVTLETTEEKLKKAKAEFESANSLAEKLLVEKTKTDHRLADLRNRAQSAEKEYESERVNSEAADLRLSLSAGDTCPVCGGKYCGYKAENYSDENALARLKEESARAKKELDEEVTKSKNIEVSISINGDAQEKAKTAIEELTKTLGNKSAQNAKKAASMAASGAAAAKRASDAEKKLTEKRSKLDIEKANAEKITEDGKRLSAEIAEIDARIKERLGDRSAADVKAAAEKAIKAYEDAQKEYERRQSELTSLATENAKRESAARAKIDENAKTLSELPDEKFDADAYARLCESLALLKTQSAETDIKTGEANAKLKDMREKLDRKKELAANKSALVKKLDLIAELNSYTKGENELLAYVAEEYVQSFTAAASDTLRTLTRGKYTLIYDGGDFYVEDFFAGGEKRKVKTLSGGETFLASVSIAMAISREIAVNRNYEFFFLDEGFGTLDERALEMVTEALITLSRETTVGIITHRSELAERIGARLNVIPATEDRGTDIVNVSA